MAFKANAGAIGFNNAAQQYFSQVRFLDMSTGTFPDPTFTIVLGYTSVTDMKSIADNFEAQITTEAVNRGYSTFTVDDIIWFGSLWDKSAVDKLINSSSQSYQTIVSQTGTAAPAVSGSFTPVSTYSGSPTFTWARTGTGVYTLTASSAVFSTSGKTGIFVAPLTNLNGSVKAVVTSTTVITVTTAVQSLAVLGLLGFTATPTDALLDKTMIYVQTYA